MDRPTRSGETRHHRHSSPVAAFAWTLENLEAEILSRIGLDVLQQALKLDYRLGRLDIQRGVTNDQSCGTPATGNAGEDGIAVFYDPLDAGLAVTRHLHQLIEVLA